MYRSPLLNKAVIPVLAAGSLAYAVYATGLMRPLHVALPPLSQPPERVFDHAIAAVGVIEPASELVAVSPRVAGWIETVHVTAGQAVSKGQPLFTLDASDLRAELAARQKLAKVAEAKLRRLHASPRPEDVPISRAAVQQAQARLDDAENNLRFIESVVDRRAVREEEVSQRRQAVSKERAAVAERQAELDRLLAGAWKEDIDVAEAELASAQASVARIQADIDRMTTLAPMDATVLRSNARAGQFASTTFSEEALMTLGSPGVLHVRADVNEQDAPRVKAGARAAATVRGDGDGPRQLEFVRFEPMVVPKRALSGFAAERVDTRVLQAIFRFTKEDVALHVGQQVDVYIDVGLTTVTGAGALSDGGYK